VRFTRIGITALASAAALGIAACGSSGSGSHHSSTTRAPAGTEASATTGASVRALTGAGSTLVAPLISVWQPVYDKQYGVAITYGAIGSGGGIEQITARTVDFGASDAPLTAAQEAACRQCLEIPWALAATVIAYHVNGVPNQLHFTGPLLADIWMGKIKRWNDPAIQKLNPGVKLPDTPIQPIHRTDGSGDTFAFTNYLSKVSPEFRAKIGNAVSVSWPGGLGAKGNSGVGGVLAATNGSIAYIAIAYVLENHFDYGLVENAAGRFPIPGIASIKAAAASLRSVPSGGTQGISITDPPPAAPDAYPISTFTYILIPKSTPPARAAALRRFVDWAVTAGQSYGPKLDFAPLPPAVVKVDEADAAMVGR